VLRRHHRSHAGALLVRLVLGRSARGPVRPPVECRAFVETDPGPVRAREPGPTKICVLFDCVVDCMYMERRAFVETDPGPVRASLTHFLLLEPPGSPATPRYCIAHSAPCPCPPFFLVRARANGNLFLTCVFDCMCTCKDSAAPAHARTRAHRPAAPRQSSGVSQTLHIPWRIRKQAYSTQTTIGSPASPCGRSIGGRFLTAAAHPRR